MGHAGANVPSSKIASGFLRMQGIAHKRALDAWKVAIETKGTL